MVVILNLTFGKYGREQKVAKGCNGTIGTFVCFKFVTLVCVTIRKNTKIGIQLHK